MRPDHKRSLMYFFFGLPLIGFGFGGTFNVEGPPTVAGDEREVGTQVRIVTADYFRTMGIPLRSGRDFSKLPRWTSAKAKERAD